MFYTKAFGASKIVELVRLSALAKAVGSIASPFEAYLALRGMKTLALRMERQCQNAQKVAEYLECHANVLEASSRRLSDLLDHWLWFRGCRPSEGAWPMSRCTILAFRAIRSTRCARGRCAVEGPWSPCGLKAHRVGCLRSPEV